MNIQTRNVRALTQIMDVLLPHINKGNQYGQLIKGNSKIQDKKKLLFEAKKTSFE